MKNVYTNATGVQILDQVKELGHCKQPKSGFHLSNQERRLCSSTKDAWARGHTLFCYKGCAVGAQGWNWYCGAYLHARISSQKAIPRKASEISKESRQPSSMLLSSHCFAKRFHTWFALSQMNFWFAGSESWVLIVVTANWHSGHGTPLFSLLSASVIASLSCMAVAFGLTQRETSSQTSRGVQDSSMEITDGSTKGITSLHCV